jgi:cellulose biosynthesis protein BcsQ
MELNRLFLPPLTAPGEVVTFYSYKGGTGRTMALSNIAVLLARRQNATVPVLMIDWDMEAPGLHHYFDQHAERPGVLEFFEACRDQLRLLDRGEGDDAALARRVLQNIDWQQYVVRVDQSSPVYLMRAGRFDASYGDRLAHMHWDQLFDACPALFRCFAENMGRHFRYVLVDSRTGRTDSAGICTTLLPNKLVVVFTPNRQSLEGVEALVTRATEYRRSHEDEQRPLLVYPLPSRIEMGDSEQRAQWRRGDAARDIGGFQPMFEQLLREAYGLPQISLDSYFDEVQLQQTKTFAYGEQLAVRIDQGGDRFSLTRTFEAFLYWVTGGYFPWQSSQEIHLLAAIEQAHRQQGEGSNRAVALPLARDLNLLGELYCREGRGGQALSCFQQSLELRVRLLGEDHADTVLSKSNLAAVLVAQGKLAEAQFLQECVVEACDRLFGSDHPEALTARARLAATVLRRGDCPSALALQDAVLDACLHRLGPEHMLTLEAQAGRAAVLLRMGQAGQARTLQENVLLARERLLGAEHPDTLAIKEALAHTLLEQNELEGAHRLLENVAQAQERRVGPDHPATLLARDRLAEVLTRMGKLAAVRLLHEGLVAVRERTLGLDHPETLTSQRKLAEILVQHGELDAARSMQEQVLQAHERVLGADHLDTLHTKTQLANTLWQQGKQEAARVLEDAILIASDRLLSARPEANSAAGANGIGLGAAVDGELTGAHGLRQAILASRERPPGHPDMLAHAISRAQALLDEEQPQRARDLADTLRVPLLRPGLAPRLRKRGMSVLKKIYRAQGDKDALVALQEDEVQALEGALSEARVAPR